MPNNLLEILKESSDTEDESHKKVAEESQGEPFSILKKHFPFLKHKLEINTEKDKENEEKKVQTRIIGTEEIKAKSNSKESLPQYKKAIEAVYTYTNPETKKVERNETITIDIEKKLEEFTSFYQKTKVDLSLDFESEVKNIWERNQDEIKKAIEQNGFDEVLIIPGNLSLPDLAGKMKMNKGYNIGSSFDGFDEENFTDAVKSKSGADKSRIVLVHNVKNLEDHPELAKTLNIKGEDLDKRGLLTLEDYIIFQKKYYESAKEHPDEDRYTWLATKKSGSDDLVYSGWLSYFNKLAVHAFNPGYHFEVCGARLSRTFF